MKALVIGGSKFFGKRLVQHLIDGGIDVTVLNRGETPDQFGDQVSRIQMDRRTLRRGHPLLKDRFWNIVYDQVCYDENDAAGACEAFDQKTERLIFTSTKSVYQLGSSISEESFDSNKYQFGAPLMQPNYGEAKRRAETVYFKNATFPVTAVRFPIVLGEDDYTGRLEFHTEHIKKGQPIYFPNIDAKMDFIYAGDAARFLFSFVEKHWEGPINCSSEPAIALRELVTILENILNKKATLAPDSTRGDRSPFGVEDHSYMSVRNLEKYGFRPAPTLEWLPKLVRMIA